MQQGAHDALYDAAGGVQKVFGNVSEVVDKSLSSIAGHSKRDESACPRSLFEHPASRGQRQNWTKAASDNKGVPMSDTN